jgi:16S rRNA (cytosine967-C5)-methyltransferase
MTPAARLSAAIEVITDIDARRRPGAEALKDWGIAHRFAGSGDRAAIAGLVYDALRRRASAAHVMGAETARAILLGMLRLERGLDLDAIGRLTDGSRFAAPPLDEGERQALVSASLVGAPPHVVGDYPEWLDPHLTRAFAAERGEEAAALARRAPLDLRVNALRADRGAVRPAFSDYDADLTPWSPWGLRILVPAGAKSPAIQSDPAFIKGDVEVQDEGSQLAALMTGAAAGETVVDLCAGGGGKTLALAAMMANQGRIVATDLDKRRLAPIHDRLARAGIKNVDVRTPRLNTDVLADLDGQADLVVIDSPCTGTGTWRRNPDAKWRMRPGALEQRIKEQTEILDRAATLVRPGGRLAYITCSVLMEENADQVAAFGERHSDFAVVLPAALADRLGPLADAFRAAALMSAHGLQMTPRRTGTDGFFVAVMRRAG